MVKAKYIARTIALHSDLGIPVYYNEPWNTGIVYWDVSLLRATYSADPQSPIWPQPAYHALRTMATVTDGAKPTDMNMEIEGLEMPYDTCRLKFADGSLLVGVWLTEHASDLHEPVAAMVKLPCLQATKIVGIDAINGTEHALRSESSPESLTIPDLMVSDYPTLIHIIVSSP